MTPTSNGTNAYTWDVPDQWQQGRGAFGGIVVGALLRAIEGVEANPSRSVRSVTAEIVGPIVPGPAQIQVELLRRGNAVSTLRAWTTQAGSDEILAHAVVVLGAPRPGIPSWAAPAPALPARPEPVLMPPGLAPVFSQHFEYRPTGPYPYSSHPRAEAAGFVRARARAVRRDAAFVAAHADAYWPAALATFDTLRPAATVAFTLHLFDSLQDAPDAEEPLYHRATSQVGQGGYASETRELYTASGALLAQNHQLIAIIK